MERAPWRAAPLRTGVWRRGSSDWAYRVVVDGYGSVAGVGFSSRDEARAAMKAARMDAESRAEDSQPIANPQPTERR